MPTPSPPPPTPRPAKTAQDRRAAKAAKTARSRAEPFWRAKKMGEMTAKEWESLCDGCGRCCLNKLTDVDTGETVYTDVGCKLLDGTTCRCTDYTHRQAKVRDCVRLTPRNVKRLTWLPPTCGYKLDRRRPRPLLVAPAGLRRDQDRAHRRHLGEGQGGGEREGRAGRTAGGFYREVAGEVAERLA